MDAPYLHWPPGFQRVDGNWVTADGEPVTDRGALERLRELAVPPAWTHVWAAAEENARVQARGLDSRGRVQYRYSPEATERAAREKYDHMLHYAECLPQLREVTLHQLRRRPPAPDREQVTALVVRFLDLGMFRVGTDKYVEDNHTYGLTTLEGRHVQVDHHQVFFDFIGKEHLRQVHTVEDTSAARIMRRVLKNASPDTPVFRVVGPPEVRVRAATVNSFIHAVSGAAASAKVARTWGGTVIAAAVAAGAEPGITSKHRDPQLLAYDAAAAALGNTATMARKSYVHPAAWEVGQSQAVRCALAQSAAEAGTDSVSAVFKDPLFQRVVLEELRNSHA